MKTDTASVQEMRHMLLALHKSLLDAQRIRYEREHGRIPSSQALLGLVLEHPAFAWLRSMSALIARLDEWMEEGDAASAGDLAEMIAALRSLIQAESPHADFGKPYWEIVNDVPQSLVAPAQLCRPIDT